MAHYNSNQNRKSKRRVGKRYDGYQERHHDQHQGYDQYQDDPYQYADQYQRPQRQHQQYQKPYPPQYQDQYQDEYQGQYQGYQARSSYNNNKHNRYPQKQKQKQYSHHKPSPKKHGKDVMIIDGSMMEGGGQILRNCTALSALLRKPISVHSIRGKRNNPGLRKQHLKGIELIQQVNGGKLTGNYIKSTEITYYPSSKGSYDNTYWVDIETAGSVCLLIQTCFPLFVYSPFECKLTIMGGTNASFAPQIDYFILVLQPMLKRLMNVNVDCQVLQRGFYPKGGGKVVVITEPLKTHISAFDLTKRGTIKSISGRVVIAGRDLTSAVGNVMIRGAVRELKICFGAKIPIKIDIVPKTKTPSLSSGIAMTVVAETDTGCLFGGSSLGDYGAIRDKGGLGGGSYSKRPYANRVDDNDINAYYEEVGRIAARELITDWKSSKGGCTDRWLQDQLIIFMALAKGKSKMATCALELHTQTAIHIAETFTGVKFNVSTMKNGTVWIECDGIGYTANMEWNQTVEEVEQKTNNKDLDGIDDNDTGNTDGNESNKAKSDYLGNRPSLF
eukprot:86154_1